MLRHASLPALALLATACMARMDSTTGFSTPLDAATIRVVNATVGGPNLDVDVGQAPVSGGSNLGFGTSTGCVSVTAAAPNMQVFNTGTTTVVPGLLLSLAPGGHYTLLVLGDGGDDRFLTLDDQTTAPSAGHARIRIVQAASEAGAVDVTVAASGSIQNTPTLTALEPNVGSGFVDAPAGAVQVTFRPTGATTPVLYTATIQLTAGSIQTLVLTDASTGGTGFSLAQAPVCP